MAAFESNPIDRHGTRGPWRRGRVACWIGFQGLGVLNPRVNLNNNLNCRFKPFRTCAKLILGIAKDIHAQYPWWLR